MPLNMSKRIGDDDAGGERPGLIIGIASKRQPKFDPMKRVGDETSSDDGADSGTDPEQLITQAAEGLCGVLNVSRLAAPKVARYLRAIFDACESMPHSEGPEEG